ncbi:MAG: 23S rRNA (guanosine(2251)-2'-O)-methyltransferase RlmB [Deltaproteobacteria bacterium]|nr:23S rRNA (guanosine(2251)-2'-O)-methyltransferase RlmB [Deltaproteobacteria bacterium]
MDQLEGRNPVLEALTRRRRRVARIWLDRGAKPDPKVDRILALAAEQNVALERVDRSRLDKLADGRVHNGVVAHADPLPAWTTTKLLDSLFEVGRSPLLVLADALSYEHNLGAILRTSLGFGVDGVIVPTARGAALSPVVQRVAMGAAEVVPLVREGLYSALKPIRDAGIRVIGADMGGVPLHLADLRGPLAILLGGEGEGLSPNLRSRCDQVVAIPLAGNLESLNVSVAAAVILYEKRRQDGWFNPAPAPGAAAP